MGKTIKRNSQYKIKKGGKSLEKDHNWKKKHNQSRSNNDIPPVDLPPQDYQ